MAWDKTKLKLTNYSTKMEEIKIAILSGQKEVKVNGVLIEGLPALPRDTQANKERFAEREARKLIEILNS